MPYAPNMAAHMRRFFAAPVGPRTLSLDDATPSWTHTVEIDASEDIALTDRPEGGAAVTLIWTRADAERIGLALVAAARGVG